MTKIFILITLLPHLLCTMVHGATPCPEYFAYTIDVKTRDVLGHIKIPFPPINDEFSLKVVLNAFHLPTELANGIRLQLAQSITESVQAVQQGRPLLYHIYFPRVENTPLLLRLDYQISLSAIWFNNQTYCLCPEASSGNVRVIELGHIVYPPHSQNVQNRKFTLYRIMKPTKDLLNNLNNVSHSKPTVATTSDEIAKNISLYPVLGNLSQERCNTNSNNNDNNDECGITSYYTDSTNGLLHSSLSSVYTHFGVLEQF